MKGKIRLATKKDIYSIADLYNSSDNLCGDDSIIYSEEYIAGL